MNRRQYKRIVEYCEEYRLFDKGDGVIAGLSGGADSVFLLFVLTELARRWDLRIMAVHVNHGIRGKEALRDEKYSVELAERLGVSCRVYHVDVPALAKEQHLSEEEAARNCRYDCFEKCRVEMKYDKIAVAHHQEDQAETVLFQMLRGSSLRGLGGMRPKRGVIVRPLLAVSRAEIEQSLGKAEIPYCVDSTNLQDGYSRNRLRNHVLPYLQKYMQPAAAAHIAQEAQQLQEIMEYLTMQTENVFKEKVRQYENRMELSAVVFAELHPVLRRELVLRMIGELAGKKKDITRAHMEAVCRLFLGDTGKKIMLPYSLLAEKSYDSLFLVRTAEISGRIDQENASCYEKGEKIAWNVPYFLPETARGQATVIFKKISAGNLSKNYQKNYCTKCFDYDRISSMPVLRWPLAGDYFWLDSTGRKKRLSRLFIDEKVPADKRRTAVVLAEGSHILWIPLLDRCSAYYYVTADTREVVQAACSKMP